MIQKYSFQGLLLTALFILLSTNACIVIENQYPTIPPGKWRAILQLDPKMVVMNNQGKPVTPTSNVSFREVARGELPFNFEVIYTNDTTFYMEIINGDERIKVEDIKIAKDRRTARDTMFIDFPEYDSYIHVECEEGVMEGKWVVRSKKDYAIPFIAKYGKDYRFSELSKEPIFDISGEWPTTFGIEGSEDQYDAVAEFKQNGNHLTGTFRTETGDYRFLEGCIQSDKIYLSTFDGSHAFLFEGKVAADSTIEGIFRSGTHYRTVWTADKNKNLKLASPDSLTYMLDSSNSFSFDFENSSGGRINLADKAYKDKVKIIQIMGTWCPNCKDETEFLTSYLKENPSDKLAVIGLAFEKYEDTNKAIETIDRYRKKMNIPYPIAYGGNYRKKEASKVLPMINQVISYPTLIFLDHNNVVRKIHTGFNGPATSKYAAFTEEFNTFVKSLIDEI